MATIALVVALISFLLSILCVVVLLTGGTGAGGRDSRVGEILLWAKKLYNWQVRVGDAVNNLEVSQDSAVDQANQPVTFPANQPGKRLGGPGDGFGAPPPPPGL